MACRLVGNILGVLLLSTFSLGSNLTATRVNDKLPIAMYGMSVFYDGFSDFIYLFGGHLSNSNLIDYILRFEISTERIERIGEIPRRGYYSPVVQDSNGDILYIDGQFRDVYKLRTSDNVLTTVGTLNNSHVGSAAAKNSAGNVLLFGGLFMRNNIAEVDIESETVASEIVGDISEPYYYTVCVKLENNTALVFGSEGRVPYIMLNLETLESSNVTTDEFPEFRDGMTVTTDQDYVYVFGGEYNTNPTNGIILLELATNTWEFIFVDNFPTESNSYFEGAPEVVWVEKTNRIYMFGGSLRNSSGLYCLDDILYVDLNPLNPVTPTIPPTTEEPPTTSLHPDLFSCDNRTDGTHPHPSDCSKYVACSNGTVEGVHPCAPPLLYDPLLETCNLPTLVDCSLNCENQEDGIYPHPRECNLFIICSQRDLFVFWCDPPLLFDPQELKCNLPGLVTCVSI